MCWNARVSLNTFAFALFVAILAYFNRKHHTVDMRLILFMIVFSTVQLAEAGVWIYYDNPAMNTFFTNIILVILVFELITAGNLIDNYKIKYAYYGLVLFYIIYLSFGYKYNNIHSIKEKNGHLRWVANFSNDTLYPYAILLLLPFLIIAITDRSYYYFIFALITLIISVVSYKKDKTISSMWCWIANMLWLIILYRIFRDTCKK